MSGQSPSTDQELLEATRVSDKGYQARNAFVERQFSGRILVRGKEMKEPPPGASRMGLNTWYLSPQRYPDTVFQDWHVFINNVRLRSGRHIHQGGICLYALEGKGYTVVDNVRHDWEAGDLVMLPLKPGGVEHQHFNAEPGKAAKWLAFIYLPQHDQVASGLKQVENSLDYQQAHGEAGGPDTSVAYQPRRDLEGWPTDSFGERAFEGEGFNGYAELIRLRNKERQRSAKASYVIRGKELPWETNPQGVMQWYMHPCLEAPVVRSYLFYRQQIPGGSRSGRQRHQGGKLLFILEGSGITEIDGVKYEVEARDLVQLPLRPDGVAFQLFNTDPNRPLLFVACEPNNVDSLGVDRGSGFIQMEDCPEYDTLTSTPSGVKGKNQT